MNWVAQDEPHRTTKMEMTMPDTQSPMSEKEAKVNAKLTHNTSECECSRQADKSNRDRYGVHTRETKKRLIK